MAEPIPVLGRPTRQSAFAAIEPRAIETPEFPFEVVSEQARLESWRKEVHRPLHHVHKWWAQRLGSVVRAAIVAAAAPAGTDLAALLRGPVRLDGHVILDPFVGSGTTCAEAQKLGARAVGLDINPVAIRAVRAALGPLGRGEVERAFESVRERVERPIRALHTTVDAHGRPAEALYWFWVKQLPCPTCARSIDLFSSRIFARHAYAARRPSARATCPACLEVVVVDQRLEHAICARCSTRFDPTAGAVEKGSCTCPWCRTRFALVAAARAHGRTPEHRLYAKLVLTADGEKLYLTPTTSDVEAAREAEARLAREGLVLPTLPIEHGHNTRQILAYNYRHWRDAFHPRQLLALGWLARAIRELDPGPAREALGVLFSGALEFNNLFATYKGEGTGAVRHMFSHHILKPERTPIEANPWGTPRSSGAFSTLYRSRLLRALDYREAPFEVLPSVDGSGRAVKTHGLSLPLGGPLHDSWPKAGLPERGLLLSTRDARSTGLPDRSVDLVVTDPPYFDNVHYSELADFFAAWTEAWCGEPARTTRAPGEVQDVDADRFTAKLRDVFAECARVLVDEGLLVLSYHHAREEGWSAIGRALLGGGFSVVEAHPVKGELSRAAPKARARVPIDIDVLLVARKTTRDTRRPMASARALSVALERASERALRYQARMGPLSLGDARVLLSSQLLVTLSPGRSAEGLEEALAWALPQLPRLVRALLAPRAVVHVSAAPTDQLELFAPGGG